jgi:signal transduction histidine kinase
LTNPSNIDSSLIDNALSKVQTLDVIDGKIKLDSTYYRFMKIKTPNGTKIGFLDVTPQEDVLNNLLIVLLLVGSISLIIMFFISLYFANKSITPVKEAFEKQNQFITDASHELKTPLAIIKTNTNLISSNGDELVKDQSKWITYINSQVDRMSALIEDLLTLSKLGYVNDQNIKTNFDLSNSINGVILSFEALLFEKQITLNESIEPNIMLLGNTEEIKRLIIILIDNALKHTNTKGTINISLSSNRNITKLVVNNSGNNVIPVEHINKIFERFYRVDDSRARETGGYGLGLAIAKSTVEKHNGRIYAESNYDDGTSFIVEFMN